MEYPPVRVVFVGVKDEKKLEVWACGDDDKYKLIKTYPVLAASGGLGPKLKEGDKQVPEGVYRVESLNPNSRYHLAVGINYPNEFDRRQAEIDGRTSLGGDIMIHGSCCSVGCLAMGDEAAEDLFVLAGEVGIDNVSVILCPVDFRKRQMLNLDLPGWTDKLYEEIKLELLRLTEGQGAGGI